jgi:phosphatidylinositol glycan class U
MLCYDGYCQKVLFSQAPARGDGNAPPAGSGKVTFDRRSLPPLLPFLLILTMVFGSILAMLFGLSRLFLPSWNFVPAVFMTPLTLPDLTPNPGLWWYFFIEMFDAFREFFLGVFWLHMLSYSVPFALRFRRQPLAGVLLMIGVIAVFQPYANAGDVGAWLSALCLLGHVFERKSNPLAICDSLRLQLCLHTDRPS